MVLTCLTINRLVQKFGQILQQIKDNKHSESIAKA